MKKISLVFAAVLLLLTSGGQAQDRSIKFETGSFESVVAKARKEKKPIFMDAYATWCGPCKWMDKNVFTNNEVADFYNRNFVNYKADMEKGEGKELARRFEVKGFPSLLFLNDKGEIIHSSMGAREAEMFIKLGQEALNPEMQLVSLQQKYKGGERKPEFIVKYIAALNSASQDITDPMEQYFKTQKPADLTSGTNWKLLKIAGDQVDLSLVKHFEKNYPDYYSKYDKDSVNLLVARIYFNQMLDAVDEKNKAAFATAKTKFDNLELNQKYEVAGRFKQGVQQMELMFLEMEGDKKAYAEGVIRMVESSFMGAPDQLNNFAWEFYEKIDDKNHLAKAEGWARRAVELQPSYENMDTHAAVLYKLGRKKEAKAVAEKAIALGKKEKKDVADTEALLKKINALK